MSCNKQHVASAICGFIENVTGEKVTQADWHALMRTAESRGYPTGRKRLDIHNTISSLRGLGETEGNAEAAEKVLADIGYTPVGTGMEIQAVNGKYPTYTQNMAGVVRMLTQEGVANTMSEIKAVKASTLTAEVSEKVSLAMDTNADPDVLEALARDSSADVREAVAMNMKTPLDTLFELTSDSDSNVVHVASKNIDTYHWVTAMYDPNTPASVLDSLAATKDTSTRQEVARHPNTAPETLMYLGNSTHLETRARVAANPNTPAETLDKLARGTSQYIVAMNPSASVSTLNFLADNAEDDHLRSLALNNLASR
jgi:hypothetical protein